MNASEIRRRFQDFFQLRGHQHLPSGSLIPGDDPTLLFTNAGMVQFKQVFLGREEVPYDRAVTAQKCVRAGGKHNDLEQVGVTARHHTFFEMLGNFSFGDYFKRDAILFAWEFLTQEIGIDPARLFVTVHQTDDEAFELWRDIAGLEAGRIFRLGDKENFWQMADTGPCGPSSELHYDLRGPTAEPIGSAAEFEALGEAGQMIELWNLVFMQFDRDEGGKLSPLPAPSIDTGAGLERLAAVLQGVDSNYHTDLFRPLLDQVAETVGRPYEAESPEGVSYRVLADHARAVAFLLADGVFPSNEGRGYVVRRILRRAVRHAWLMGLRRPSLVDVVQSVISSMAETYPELGERASQILDTTRREEERFLSTIEEGMERFDVLAPVGDAAGGIIAGAEAFKLYDTFGFPLDLTQVMARERGFDVDEDGFHTALEEQRERSRTDRAESSGKMDRVPGADDWTVLGERSEQRWVGWDCDDTETEVLAVATENGRTGMIVDPNPYYVEAGGQVSDGGVITGVGWRLSLDDVRRVEGRTAVFGTVEGLFPEDSAEPIPARATVDRAARHDTERNHTATHLLHAALRKVLGGHVTQRGSLVSPARLRFDFSHPAPVTTEELDIIERQVNEWIWEVRPVTWSIAERDEAVARGAMALFGEKYGDRVRVVEIPEVSLELCGGTHLRRTAEAGVFVINRESGVASGVRRIEAVTAAAAYRSMKASEHELHTLASRLRTNPETAVKRVDDLLRERAEMETLLEGLRRTGSGGGETVVHEAEVSLPDGGTARYRAVRMNVRDADDARVFGDAFREAERSAVLVVGSESPDGKSSLFVFVTDDLIGRGVRAGSLIGEIAAIVDGRGGGRPHMAQAGVEDPSRIDDALRAGEGVLRAALENAPA